MGKKSEEYTRLPDAEMDIMNYIWEKNKPVTSLDIKEGLKNRRNWTAATILNLLSRLTKKGFVVSKKGDKYNLYSAVIKRDDYLSQESRTILDHVYNGSVSRMISALCGNASLSDKDINYLKAFIEEKSSKEDIEKK